MSLYLKKPDKGKKKVLYNVEIPNVYYTGERKGIHRVTCQPTGNQYKFLKGVRGARVYYNVANLEDLVYFNEHPDYQIVIAKRTITASIVEEQKADIKKALDLVQSFDEKIEHVIVPIPKEEKKPTKASKNKRRKKTEEPEPEEE